jgi:serine/threonine protein phosphatase PrpC
VEFVRCCDWLLPLSIENPTRLLKMTEIYIDIHHDNHLNRPRSRKALKTFGALGRFLALATFSSICMIIISVSMPRSPRHNDNNNIMTETIVFQEQEKIDPCSFYGCPIYPLEFNRNNFSQQQEESTHSSYAMITRIGESHRINQDRAALFTPFLTKLSPSTVDSFLVALFDGHGRQGHIIAEYCIEEFPYRLAKKLNELSDPVNDKDILRAMNETFLETDIYAPPNALEGGATATISLRIGSKLYIGNVGDSQTILVSADSAVAYMTRKDKAILPEERSRIEGLGGKIFINPQNISRVVVYSVTARESIALAMSRSIGDWEWKPVGKRKFVKNTLRSEQTRQLTSLLSKLQIDRCHCRARFS